MGVDGLWPLLSSIANVQNFTALITSEVFRGGRREMFVLGVDASHWLWQAMGVFQVGHSQNGENPELRIIFRRLVRLLGALVKVVFVFDGPGRPLIKRNKIVSRKAHWLTPKTQELITAFGFDWYIAPGEAEAELAYLNQAGLIDAVLTDDGDAFLFGAQCVIRNPNIRRDGEDITVYTSDAIENAPEIGWTQGGMILVALLSGGDYDSVGLIGCGAKIAGGIARSGLGDSLLTAVLTLTPAALFFFLVDWRHQLRLELSTDPHGFLGRRYPTVAEAVPDTFPNLSVLQAYAFPTTSWSNGNGGPNWQLSQSQTQNIGALTKLCRAKFGWTLGDIQSCFERGIWPGVFLRMLFKSDFIYNLQHRHSVEDFNTSSVLDILQKKTHYGVRMLHIRTSTTHLTRAASAAITRKKAPSSRATFSAMWIPSIVMESALPEMVQEFEHQIRTKIRTPTGKHRKSRAQIFINSDHAIGGPGTSRETALDLTLNDEPSTTTKTRTQTTTNTDYAVGRPGSSRETALILDDYEPPVITSSSFWTAL